MLIDNIICEQLEIGIGVHISPSAIIKGINGPAKRIRIGDHTYIGPDVQIICDDFSIGDYSKIHHHTNIHGYKSCHIGHNAWIGQYALIDSIGGISIGNNCGIGAHTQLWSHIKFGDTLEGCRFLEQKQMQIGNDVWFVGHCIVSPIQAADKSMALTGSVITKDMDYNTIYAGVPAKPVTDALGRQFNERTVDEKMKRMRELLVLWGGPVSDLRIVSSAKDMDPNDDISYFNVSDRTYTKKQLQAEIDFMKFLLPEKAKFTPYEI